MPLIIRSLRNTEQNVAGYQLGPWETKNVEGVHEVSQELADAHANKDVQVDLIPDVAVDAAAVAQAASTGPLNPPIVSNQNNTGRDNVISDPAPGVDPLVAAPKGRNADGVMDPGPTATDGGTGPTQDTTTKAATDPTTPVKSTDSKVTKVADKK